MENGTGIVTTLAQGSFASSIPFRAEETFVYCAQRHCDI